jgi:hypothetical protein
MLVTGITELDELMGYIPSDWLVEFYGDWKIVNILLHRMVILNAKGGVLVAYTQKHVGLDPSLLKKLSRRLEKTWSKGDVLLARAFKVEDTIELLSKISMASQKRVFVVDPYLHIPRTPEKYYVATKVTAGLRKIARAGKEVAIFNRISRYGYLRPEGGNYHHHSIHVMIRLWPTKYGVRATLIKHPLKTTESVIFPYSSLTAASGRWSGQRRLIEWF